MNKLLDFIEEVNTKPKSRYVSIKKKLKTLTRAAFCAYLAVHTPYAINTVSNDLFPKKQRQAFEEMHGIDLKGWPSVLESDNRTITNISDVVQKEMQELPFNINSIRVRSDNHFLNQVSDHLTFIFSPDNGHYLPTFFEKLPILDSIVLNNVDLQTLHHEIKHAKTFEVLRKHPQFRQEWEDLSKDSNGNSLYLSRADWVFSKLRIANRLVNKKSEDEARKLGFISEYARTDFPKFP